MPSATSTSTVVLIILLVLFFILLLGGALWSRISYFCEQLRYINMELNRVSASERPFWRRRRRKLWLWLFFLGRG